MDRVRRRGQIIAIWSQWDEEDARRRAQRQNLALPVDPIEEPSVGRKDDAPDLRERLLKLDCTMSYHTMSEKDPSIATGPYRGVSKKGMCLSLDPTAMRVSLAFQAAWMACTMTLRNT